MSDIVRFSQVEEKIINIRNQSVILDSDLIRSGNEGNKRSKQKHYIYSVFDYIANILIAFFCSKPIINSQN